MKKLKSLKTSNNNKLLVVIPINKYEDEILNESLYSLSNQTESVDCLILASESMNNERIGRISEIASKPCKRVISQDEEGNAKSEIVESEKALNFVVETTPSETFSQIFNESFNIAKSNEYEWFSIIEQDDLVEEKWIENFNKYSSELDHVSIFFPLLRQISAGNMTGYINEAPWLEGKAEVAGQADLQMMMAWNCLNPTGAFYKIDDIAQYSEDRDGVFYPYKENLKISSSYEFFLRMVYEDLKTYTIPRNGYQLRMDTATEYLDKFSAKIPSNITSLPKEKGGMSNHEIGFWMEQAKTEYFMTEDREIEYEEPVEA